MTRKTPEIIEVDLTRLEEVLRRVEENLDQEDCQLLRALLAAYVHLTELVGDKSTTIQRLRKLLFGSPTEKTAAVVGGAGEAQNAAPPADGAEGQPLPASSEESPPQEGAPSSGESPPAESPPADSSDAPPPPGHGRNGASAHPGAERVYVPHASLEPGDSCPDCGKGTVYEQPSGVLLRFVGQAPVQVKIIQLQKLRCGLCGKIFTAEPPPETPAKKYDATVASMIALLKYGSGMPFNRLEGLQGSLGMPLPASTQWEIVFDRGTSIAPGFQELIRQAAQGDVVYNDDTHVKILETIRERLRLQGDQAGAEADSSRSGLFTSGVVSTCEGHRIALFFSGPQHCGENLADVLKHRAEELAKPIQMCDALSRNMPEELQTIIANCLAHGRRHFVDIYDRFPDECRYVLEALKVVYHNDSLAKQRKLSPQERLVFHQQESQPTMEELKQWLDRQLDEKLVEPNSALGQAIRYMLNHWTKLTLFLREAGAPLDNNICERALKKAILHRKNAYFYKSSSGARIGDLYMSLIHTCELCGVNAFNYLTALHQHPEELAAHPARWMPWNYQSALAELEAGSNSPAVA